MQYRTHFVTTMMKERQRKRTVRIRN